MFFPYVNFNNISYLTRAVIILAHRTDVGEHRALSCGRIGEIFGILRLRLSHLALRWVL